ncbi:MAG: ABC transporter substrate-binding protein, partial [Myxococcota bacterium]
RLGYFPNITHAPALVAVERGTYTEALGAGVTLETATFNAGPAAVEAVLSGALDATFIGPNPAINAYVKSKGEAVRVVAGSTSGGAFLVVDPSIAGPADLKGKKLATPQLGNTQDVALRAWLGTQGYKLTLDGANDVTIAPMENAQSLEALRSGSIAGAWVPEPWATRMILEGNGKVLVDERTLWPEGRYVTVHLMVRAPFLAEHPDVVEKLLTAHVDTIEWIVAHPDEAQQLTNAGIKKITGKDIKPEVLKGSWANLTFTTDPIATSLRKSADDAVTAGLLDLEGVNLAGIHDLTLLNKVLAGKGQPVVAVAQ